MSKEQEPKKTRTYRRYGKKYSVEPDGSKKIIVPYILAKKEHSVKTNTPESSTSSNAQPKLLLKQKDPVAVERATSQTTILVEASDSSKEINHDVSASLSSLSIQSESLLMKKPLKLLSSELQFNTESITPFIQEQSNDFFVVAFIGPQNSGKSSLANILLNPCYNLSDFQKSDKTTFKMRTKQDMFQLGQITEGIDIFITKNRVIILDCAPLLSNASCKDYILSELDDLKILTFLFNVCNLVVMVQETCLNSNIVRLLHVAEMMRMKSNEDEHLAKVMLVQNKVGKDQLTEKHSQDMKSLYKTIFHNSNINCYSLQSMNEEELKMVENVNFIAIPDLKDSHQNASIKQIIDTFRMQILMTKGFTTKYTQVTQFSEKMWLQSLSKTWDANSTNYFFKKYGNLKEKFNLLNHVSINDSIKYDKNVYYPDD